DYKRVATELGLGREDDLMAAIGYGKFSARSVLGRLAPTSADGEATEEKQGGFSSVVRRVFGSDNSSAIVVKGHDDLLVYRAKCCNPIRGEDIIGYVTRGKGVAVHSRTCPNVANLINEADRRIAVEWSSVGKDGKDADGIGAGFQVKLTVYCDDRPGMLKEIATVM